MEKEKKDGTAEEGYQEEEELDDQVKHKFYPRVKESLPNNPKNDTFYE